MRAHPLCITIATLSLLGLTGADEARSVRQRVATEAEKVLNEVKETSYEHKVQIDEPAGQFETDCSGFVEFVLHQAAPSSLTAVSLPKGHKRPLAEDFYQAFKDAPATSERQWQRIDHVADALPGDIIAWKSLTHETGDHTDTGHVMVIVAPPIPQSKPTEFGLVVIDSTKSPHDHDTRKADETGVGRGTIYVEIDEHGNPRGYHWKKPGGELHDNPIAIGRPLGE